MASLTVQVAPSAFTLAAAETEVTDLSQHSGTHSYSDLEVCQIAKKKICLVKIKLPLTQTPCAKGTCDLSSASGKRSQCFATL